ncbi:imm11 family protein [Psychromonas algicola]|uniref:imm11 family protein n=1 Tax=Psychromonas algicola TaxID=2555642 RepID=UPI001067CF7D|nr:DUF1629 domain-containing protein [Psychromonas sp. RZ5]TEW52545.1 hypothetical protein E2R67_02630 [Psychromonas sp. RZ5]
MKYWVFKSDFGGDGVYLSSLPGEGPEDYEYSDGIVLADRHPNGKASAMYYDPSYPERTKLFDFIDNLDGVLIANQKVVNLLKDFGVDNVEYLPVWLMDHQDSLVSKDYFILNVLGGVEIIDMEASTYRMGVLIEDQVDRIKNLVVSYENIPKNAHLFRASKKTNAFFISDDLKQAFEQNKVKGYRAIAADGWNGRG